jgi:hypothetical protein
MENPFVYGKVVRGKYFADREAEIDELKNDIASSQNVIVFSPRRYGKTSLILEVLDRVKDEGLLTCYIDLFKVTSQETFIAAYAREVARLQGGRIQTMLKKIRDLLPRLVPKVVMKGEKVDLEVEFEFDPRADKGPLFDDLFEAVATMSLQMGKRAVVVFDEFQEITGWDVKGQIERQMRTHFQMHESVSYIFMGSKRHLMQELFRNKNRPFYRFGKHFPLGKIPKDEFAEFIQRHFEETGYQTDPDAIREILHVADDHPYYTQLLCHILWDRKRLEKVIAKEDIYLAVQEVFMREAHAFHDIWDMLPLKSRQLLVALAKEENPQVQLFSSNFLQKHNLGSASSVQRAIARLLEEEVLEKTDGGYQFTDIFFKRWLREM